VPITTKVVSSNPVHGKVYLIPHYVIMFVSGLWFSPGTPVSSTNKTDDHDITEILSKVELNTIHQTYFFNISICILILIFVCLFRILDGRKTFNLCRIKSLL